MPSWHGAQLKHRENFTFYQQYICKDAVGYFKFRSRITKFSIHLFEVTTLENISNYTILV
jgi:hypothetical protein